MKHLLVFLLGLSLFSLTSCKEETTADDFTAEQEAAIQSVLEDSADIAFDAINDEAEGNFSGTAGSGMQEVIDLRFGRIRNKPVERSIEIVKETDSTATAYVHTRVEGKFVVAKSEMSADTLKFEKYSKDFAHEIDRVVHLIRFQDLEDESMNWKIDEVSLAAGQSVPDNKAVILQVKITSPDQDPVIITDPLAYFQEGANVFTFPQWEEVTVEVTVKNNLPEPDRYYIGDSTQSETVLLHHGRAPRSFNKFYRTAFDFKGQDANGNNLYEGTWSIREVRGMHNAVIDVIENNTIYNKDAGYDSNTWQAAYRVVKF